MRVTIALAGLSFVAAVSLTAELITHEGVGPGEYVVGFALVIGLLTLAVQTSRRITRRSG